MQYRKFGKTGETVSILGFGCMRLPVVDGKPEKIDSTKTDEMLNYAYDHGVNYFDTAYTYHRPMDPAVKKGFSEDVLGNCFRGSKREKIFFATKLPTFNIYKKEEFEETLNGSLRSLKTDRIDFYLAHSLTKPTWDRMVKLGMLEFLQKAKESGKVRHLGFSFHDDLSVFKEIINAFNWEFAQIQYNYLDVDRQAGTEGLHYASSKGLGMTIMEPLRGGKLINIPSKEINDLWKESEHPDWTPAQRGLYFVWNDPAVSVVLSGMGALEQVKENIAAAENAAPGILSEKELALYSRVRDMYWKRIIAPCTGCEYCMPCPQGVNIPENLNVLNELYMFDNFAESKRAYEFLPKESRAEQCINCGTCLTKCPQKIQIPDHMSELTNRMA
ncbi:MAG: aldo/keto reductase [Flexilinea sp.]|nr:aldo/keto reductase [Flexilinea sp.]